MSIESARAFFAKMRADADFARQVNGIRRLEEAEAFVARAGFDCTMDEFERVGGELADDELDQAVGGRMDPTWWKKKPCAYGVNQY